MWAGCVIVAGFVAQRARPETWNDRFFLVGELIPRPLLTEDLNDSTPASAVHMMVTNTWMNTKH